MTTTNDHALLGAAEALRLAIEENLERNQLVLGRLAGLIEGVEAGDHLIDLAHAEPAPRIAELLTQNLGALETAGAAFRTAHAQALHDCGLTMDTIGELFGVSRQRVSAMLRAGGQRTSAIS